MWTLVSFSSRLATCYDGGSIITYGPRVDLRSRCTCPQPQEYRRRPAAQQARRDYRPVRIRQVVARVRHDLRRGAAPLRRIAVSLRTAIPRTDGEAGRRLDRRAVSGNLNRAEDDGLEPAIDRGHGHRNLRLPAPALRQHRHTALFELRQGDHEPVAGADRGHGDALSAG